MPGDPFVRKVRGLRRQWGVAMDNRVDLPGYKFFVRDGTGERHEGHVAFLDLVEEPGAALNGVLFEVSEGELADLDDRERNYSRADVTAHVIDPPGPVIAYVGTEEGRARFAAGVAAGDLVASDAYIEQVGGASAPPLPCPVARLNRIDL
jgi:hypothetical protein